MRAANGAQPKHANAQVFIAEVLFFGADEADAECTRLISQVDQITAATRQTPHVGHDDSLQFLEGRKFQQAIELDLH